MPENENKLAPVHNAMRSVLHSIAVYINACNKISAAKDSVHNLMLFYQFYVSAYIYDQCNRLS